MSFTLVLLADTEWRDRLVEAVPGIRVLTPTPDQAPATLSEADAAYGALPPDLLRHAHKLRWLQAVDARRQRRHRVSRPSTRPWPSTAGCPRRTW